MAAMDAHTEKTRAWLDKRFAKKSPDGAYFAHQPIYGFDGGHCEPSLLPRYVRTLEIMRALAHLRFESCLDAGAAEGYKAALVRRLFAAQVTATDLSENACRRAREIFGLSARSADLHELPFADGEFDVALCSETLEHVTEVEAAMSELLRVARTAVVVTVPRESERDVKANVASGEPHAHIHSFAPDSLDSVAREAGRRLIVRPIVSPLTAALGGLVEGTSLPLKEPASDHRLWNALVRVSNGISPLTARWLGERAEARLVDLDRVACRALRLHRALLFVVLKDPAAWSERAAREPSAADILSFKVPFHYLDA